MFRRRLRTIEVVLLAWAALSAPLLCSRAGAATAVEFQVPANSDDAEQANGGGMSLNNKKPELGQMLWVGFRFTGVSVPKGATITAAYLRLRAADTNTESTNLTLFGQAHDNPGTFTNSNNDISSRARTSASADWNPVPNWSNGTWYESPQITTIVQEIVNRAGWSQGNSIAILVRSNDVNGKRLVRARDQAAAQAAILHVEYTLAAPVGHWQLGESSGTTAVDSSIFVSNGTVSGPANWSTRCNGVGVFDFNGGSNRIRISNSSQLQPNTGLSIAAWIKGDAWDSGTSVNSILRKGPADPNNYQLAIADGKVAMYLDDSDGGGVRSTTTLVAGQWYHVAGTWDGSNVRIYVDGVLETTTARSGTIGTDNRTLFIGGRPGADQFDGQIHDVRLYNRGLSATEVSSLAGVSGHWRFFEGVGSTAADSSPLANGATLSGGAAWTTSCAGDPALLTNGSGGIAQTTSEFTPPDVGTVAFWMRSSGEPATVSRIMGVGADWEVRQNPDGRVISDLCGDGATTIGTVTPLTEVNRWYHVAMTFDSANDSYAIYVDGQLELSGTNPNNLVQQPAGLLSFGTRTGSTEYWQGALRDFRIYSRKLCPAEVASLAGYMGEWKLDQASGTTAIDSSPAVNHGTYMNGVTLGGTGPKSGTVAAQFDGSNDYVDLPDDNSDFRNGITIAAWARFASTASWGRIADYGAGGSDLYNFVFARNGTSATLEFAIHGGTLDAPSSSAKRYVQATNAIVLNEWRHYAVTVNSLGSAKLYRDGVEISVTGGSTGYPTIGLPMNVTRTTNYLARSNWSADSYYDGKLWDVRIYSRALCPSEIYSLYGGSSFSGIKIIKWVEIQ